MNALRLERPRGPRPTSLTAAWLLVRKLRKDSAPEHEIDEACRFTGALYKRKKREGSRR